MSNLSKTFRKDVNYDNFKSKKVVLQPLSRRYIFWETTGGVENSLTNYVYFLVKLLNVYVDWLVYWFLWFIQLQILIYICLYIYFYSYPLPILRWCPYSTFYHSLFHASYAIYIRYQCFHRVSLILYTVTSIHSGHLENKMQLELEKKMKMKAVKRFKTQEKSIWQGVRKKSEEKKQKSVLRKKL